MPRINTLFICSRNQWRSPTAEQVFRDDSRLNVRSRGLSRKSPRPLAESDLAWADLVLVMENKHRQRIQQTYRSAARDATIHVLDIPDDFQFMDPELVDILDERVNRILDQSNLE